MSSTIATCIRCGIRRQIHEGRDRGVCKDCPAGEQRTELTSNQRGTLAHYSLQRAAELACMVRDEGRDAIGAFLDRLDRQALYGLTVALAAMVPDDQPVDQLIAWIDWHEEAAA